MKPKWILCWTLLSLAACLVPDWVHLPLRLVYNASDSVPKGWYRISPAHELHVGDTVLTRLPANIQAFAAQRGYLPDGTPLLKQIGALAPQRVCVRNRVVHVDGHAVAIALAHDPQHRPLPAWSICRPLMKGEMFLLSDTHPASFDSRYWGPIDTATVIGNARPLWTREIP